MYCFKSKTTQKTVSKDGEVPFSWTQNPAFGGNTAQTPRKPLEAFNVYDVVDEIHPQYFINLRSTSVNASSNDNISKYAFEIVVPPSKNLFSTESRHTIKATSEEEMVDWFVAIKAKSQLQVQAQTQAAFSLPVTEEEPERGKQKQKEERKLSSSIKGFGRALFGRDKPQTEIKVPELKPQDNKEEESRREEIFNIFNIKDEYGNHYEYDSGPAESDEEGGLELSSPEDPEEGKAEAQEETTTPAVFPIEANVEVPARKPEIEETPRDAQEASEEVTIESETSTKEQEQEQEPEALATPAEEEKSDLSQGEVKVESDTLQANHQEAAAVVGAEETEEPKELKETEEIREAEATGETEPTKAETTSTPEATQTNETAKGEKHEEAPEQPLANQTEADEQPEEEGEAEAATVAEGESAQKKQPGKKNRNKNKKGK